VSAKWARPKVLAIAAAALLGAAAPAGVASVASVASPAPVLAVDGQGSGPAAAGARVAGAHAQPGSIGPAAAQQAQSIQAAAARAAEARAAQRAATARQRAQTAGDSHGHPNRMIIVRARTVDSVTNGELTQRVVRAGGVLTPARLDGYVPNGWITIANGVTRLSAALRLSRGVVLDVGGDITTLQLAGGGSAPEAASIYTGSGRLTLHGVTVTSIDPGTGRPVAPGAGRPFIQVGSGGRLEATDSTFSDLGTPATQPQGRAGIGFATGSTGSLVRTAVLRNSIGVRLAGSLGVRLEGVTVAESAADGLVLLGDRGTTLAGVRAERNADNGVRVSGPSRDRPITGISTLGNGRFGLAVISQTAPVITGIRTQADGVGGLQLAGDADPVVTDFSALDQPIGVLTHISSNRVTLDRLRISGGRRGLVVEKTTTGLALTGSTIHRTQTGISIGGQNIDLRDVLVGHSQSGVRIERGAHTVTATALHLTGGQDGVVVLPGATNVVLRDLLINDVAHSSIRTSGPGAAIRGGRISGGGTGIDAEAATIISGTEISRVGVGIRARSTTLVTADNINVAAASSGITVQEGSPFVLINSRVDARQAVNGHAQYQGLNNLSRSPLTLLDLIGIPLILLALLLDQIQRFRQRTEAASSGDSPRPRCRPQFTEAANLEHRTPVRHEHRVQPG
jgi:hypothetical protein